MQTKKTLLIDTRQVKGKHKAKHDYFEQAGLLCVRTKLYVGDYTLVGSVNVCDTKASISELAQNIDQDHDRFRRELINARDAGFRLTVLTENEFGIRSVEDLAKWTEPESEFRKRRNAVRRLNGLRLAKACITMSERYEASFDFCAPEEAGHRVLQILTEGGGGGGQDDGRRGS